MFFEGLIYPPVRPLRPAVCVIVAALVLEAGANLDAGVSQGAGAPGRMRDMRMRMGSVRMLTSREGLEEKDSVSVVVDTNLLKL